MNVSENITLDQLREKRKSWDGSQSLPSNIAGRAKSETPPRQRQTKSSANLQKDSDFGKEIPHSSNEIDSSQSKIETGGSGKDGDIDVTIAHSHDKTPEASVIDKQTLPRDSSSEATYANTDVQHQSSIATEESSKDGQDETYSRNRQSSQSQFAICDNDNAKGATENIKEATDGQGSGKQVKAQHVDDKLFDEQGNASISQNEAESTISADISVNGQGSQSESSNHSQKDSISAVLTVSESETIQYDPSILRNRDHEPSPEKRLGANLSMIVENRLSSESSEVQLQVKEIIMYQN